MRCAEAVFAEDVLSYIVDNYRGEEYIREFYNPDCYIRIDEMQGVIYQQVQSVDGAVIEKYGFSAIPNVYGLMSEEALERSGVLRIRRQPSFDLYGQGVLIGFADTGIDYTHEAFRAADGTSRILSIWDQTIREGAGSKQFPYGRMYEREEIDEALLAENPWELVPSRDENGHGTFMAGVAAGTQNREEQFSGVAPLSDIIMVKCKQAGKSYRDYYGIPEGVPAYQENDIMAAVAYLLGESARLERSIIICIGMGSNMGNHNGSSSLGVFLNRYPAIKGVGIVSCVGNEGNARHHHRIRGRDESIDISVEENMKGFMSQLWWQTPGKLQLDITSPGGESVTGIRAISGVRYEHRFVAEDTTLNIFFGVAQEVTREQVVVFRFTDVRRGIWKVRVRFDTEVTNSSIWLPISQFLERNVVFLDSEPDTTLTNPGTTSLIVSVTAYDVRDNALYFEAGRGFTPSGVIKPEVAAPGVEIMGTYPGNRYGIMTGTSVAAAFTAGISALFMQQYAGQGANSNTLREALIRGAVPRGEPYPNTEWGYGMIDAYRSITDY